MIPRSKKFITRLATDETEPPRYVSVDVVEESILYECEYEVLEDGTARVIEFRETPVLPPED